MTKDHLTVLGTEYGSFSKSCWSVHNCVFAKERLSRNSTPFCKRREDEIWLSVGVR